MSQARALSSVRKPNEQHLACAVLIILMPVISLTRPSASGSGAWQSAAETQASTSIEHLFSLREAPATANFACVQCALCLLQSNKQYAALHKGQNGAAQTRSRCTH